ncbi:MAG: hypothetical protein JNJ77_07015 [Planctomycetia bacterium]|nr:hypothetical protein [Planctomycetia bacterium]
MLAFVLICCLQLGDNPYTVDQVPPVPRYQPDLDNHINDDDGFPIMLGALLSLSSDSAFPRFIGPSSNPWLAKDPRSLTEARLLGVGNWTPSNQVLGNTFSQSYLLQTRVALTKRWQVFMDKNGYSFIDPENAPGNDGWNNLAFGAKYVLIRDVEQQRLLSAAVQLEIPTGEASVFQRPSDGSLTGILTFGQEFWCFWHLLGNAGVRAPLSNDGSTLLFTQLHLDRELFGWLHPLAEFNYYRILTDGRGVYPAGLGQGDAMLDWSIPQTTGSDLVTVAVGLKARYNRMAEFGVTYERPLSETPRLLEHRIIAEVVVRY